MILQHRPRRALGLLVAGGASVLLLAGCGSNSVAKADVEKEVSTQLHAQQPTIAAPNISCPGDLKGKVGTVMTCTLSVTGETDTYDVAVTVTSVSGSDVKFDVKVADAANGAGDTSTTAAP